jgi:predicted ATPase
MTHSPITQLDVENYGCIRKASFHLTPLHAFIGPNDSGKSTALRALRTAAQFACGDFGDEPNTRPRPFDPIIDTKVNGPTLGLHYGDKLAYVVRNQQGVSESVYEGDQEVAKDDNRRGWNLPGLLHQGSAVPAVQTLAERLTTATMVRFDPNALRRPSKQILANDPIRFFDETGEGLASVYQAINSQDVDAFVTIRDRIRTQFPAIQSILVPTVENNNVILQARLVDGTVVPAHALSDGILYFLGYAALQYISESKLFLVEEPENGLHPTRIAEVMTILRTISERSQVIIATHSPLVVNELEGHEISVVTRDPMKGTQAIVLRDTPNYAERSQVYQNGELWVSYADGHSEAPLLDGTARIWVRGNPEQFK